MKMRLFIAINFGENELDAFEAARDRLRERAGRANYSRRENLHLTLAFLGEQPQARLPDARAAMLAAEARLADELRARGFSLEERRFSPHLTLARQVLSRAEPGALLGSAVACPVRDIRLMLSERPGGRLTYTELFRAPFPR